MIARGKDCASAEEFLGFLHPRNTQWQPTPDQWIFRGHGDATWELKPKAFRREAWDEFAGNRFDPSVHNEGGRQRKEAELLISFGRELDRVGLALPERAHAGIEYLERLLRDNSFPDEYWVEHCASLAALAQHHGLPTRLLDFTEDGRIAAYFAAQEPKEEADRMCVWAVYRDYLERISGEPAPDGTAIQTVRAPRSSNPNLHAQSGLFVAWDSREQILPLDKVLESRPEQGGATHRFTLPRSEAGRLLTLLRHERITGATMYPNVDGVVRYLKEKGRYALVDPFLERFLVEVDGDGDKEPEL